MRMARLLRGRPRGGGHPVNAGVRDRTERLRRTGSSAFADDDGSLMEKSRDRSRAFVSMTIASVRSALRRRCRPRLDQRVVVDGFALRLLVRQLALGRDVAVLGR